MTKADKHQNKILSVFNLKKDLIFFVLIILFFCFIHIYKMGRVSFSFDERFDAQLVQCYVQSKNPFSCPYDITQTRLPHYIHALFYSISGSGMKEYSYYAVSFVFGLFNLILVYWFAKKIFNLFIANVTLLLMSTSIPLLTSSRMILTHSNVIFTTFTLLTMISFYYFLDSNRLKYLICAAIFFGLSLGSNILGIFTSIFLLIFYVTSRRQNYRWRFSHLCFLPVSVASFFVGSIIHLQKDNLYSLIQEILSGETYEFWNYFNLGTDSAPWWFSLLIFIVKLSPWWTLFFIYFLIPTLNPNRIKDGLKLKFLFSTFSFIIIYLILKSVIFRYDAPHHQVHFYPFACLIIAYSVFSIYQRVKRRERLKGLFVAIMTVLFVVQITQLFMFFPNLLFYGAQYGRNFVGEFYGPAVLHGQDLDEINSKIKEITGNDEQILIQDHTSLPRAPEHVPFSKRNREKKYRYAFLDYLHGYHLRFPEKYEYVKFLKDNYQKYYIHYFPGKFEIYTIYRHKDYKD